jgi:hypothetical protein
MGWLRNQPVWLQIVAWLFFWWVLLFFLLWQSNLSQRTKVWITVAGVGGFLIVGAVGAATDTKTTAVATSTATKQSTAESTTTTVEATTTTEPSPPAPTAPVAEVDRKGDPPNPGALYPGRAGARDNDHEQVVGEEPVRFAGWSVWVLSAEFVDKPGQYECCGFLRLRVRLLNRNSDDQTWYRTDFSIQTPSGEVYSPAIVVEGGGDRLGINGGLVHGGTTEGDLWFHIGDKRGDFFITFEPQSDPNNDDRGVWKVSVPA